MTKTELQDKIRTIVRRVYSAKVNNDSLPNQEEVRFEEETYPLLTQFPTLKTVIVNLLTNQYKNFIKDIWWVAPKPTTFKVILENDQFFYLIYTGKSWVAKVEGKKYYLNNISDEQRAAQSISNVLMYGASITNKDEASSEIPTGGEMPADETSPEVVSPEVPPTEEVPEEVPA
jgi:hypothetical protein